MSDDGRFSFSYLDNTQPIINIGFTNWLAKNLEGMPVIHLYYFLLVYEHFWAILG